MLYQESVSLGEINDTFTVLSCIPNSAGYVAAYLDFNGDIQYADFPFFLFVQTSTNRYFLAGLSQIIINPSFAFTNYIGYFAAVPETITLINDYSINPFMPESVVNLAFTQVGGG